VAPCPAVSHTIREPSGFGTFQIEVPLGAAYSFPGVTLSSLCHLGAMRSIGVIDASHRTLAVA
jgi:hypothetical protein